jgi:phage I-like protein
MAQAYFIAALHAEISNPGATLKLLPAGEFRASDGRPLECAAWRLDAAHAQRLIDTAAASANRYVIDYEHQTLNAASNGQPAPAAAWFKTLEWRADAGLYATDVEWTERASEMIHAREYRYLSPVIAFDRAGNITALLHAALTNRPALDCLGEVQLAAASRLVTAATALSAVAIPAAPSIKESGMDELLEQLRWLLNLPAGATAGDISTQSQKLIDSLSGGQGVAAASANLPELLTRQREQIATLSAQQVDPAKFVPVALMTDLRSQLDAANLQLAGKEVSDLVTVALSDGRLLPVQESWARELGKSNVAALKTYLATAQPIAALRTTQTGGIPPNGDKTQANALDAPSLAICKALGITPEAFAKSSKPVV